MPLTSQPKTLITLTRLRLIRKTIGKMMIWSRLKRIFSCFRDLRFRLSLKGTIIVLLEEGSP